MKLRKILLKALVLSALSACSLPHSDLKSPCAGTEGSPCGPHRPVNDWWMNHGQAGQST